MDWLLKISFFTVFIGIIFVFFYVERIRKIYPESNIDKIRDLIKKGGDERVNKRLKKALYMLIFFSLQFFVCVAITFIYQNIME